MITAMVVFGASLIAQQVKNLSANAGEHGFDPWSGKIPHALGQLSSVHHNYWAWALESANN